MQKITLKQLEAQIEYLNRITNQPLEPWTEVDGKVRANIGNYHLHCAYGGYELHQICNEGGRVHTPLDTGIVSKRELYNAIRAFIRGYNS